jgi:hypothetical protein
MVLLRGEDSVAGFYFLKSTFDWIEIGFIKSNA